MHCTKCTRTILKWFLLLFGGHSLLMLLAALFSLSSLLHCISNVAYSVFDEAVYFSTEITAKNITASLPFSPAGLFESSFLLHKDAAFIKAHSAPQQRYRHLVTSLFICFFLTKTTFFLRKTFLILNQRKSTFSSFMLDFVQFQATSAAWEACSDKNEEIVDFQSRRQSNFYYLIF